MTKNFVQKSFVFLLMLFVFIIPWQTRFIYKDIMLDGQTWQFGRLSIYASLLLLWLGALAFGWHRREQWHLSKNKWWYSLFFYGLAICLSSPLPILGLYYLFIIFGAILFIWLAQGVSKKNILWALLLSGLVQSILAIYQSLTQNISANKWLGMAEQLAKDRGVSVLESGDMRILRAYGALPHPNILAGFLVLAILAGLYLWHSIYAQSEQADWQIKKIKQYTLSLCLVIVSLVLMSFALLTTFSRSALLALMATLLFIFIFSIIKKDKLTIYVLIKYVVLLIIAFFAFNLYYPNLWASRFDLSNRLEAKSIQDRGLTYGQLNWSNPKEIIFGQGLGMNTYWVSKNNDQLPVDQIQPIHNWYLLAVAEVGLVGVFMLLVLLYFYLKKNLFIKNKNQVWTWSFVLLILLLGLFDHYLWTSWTGWLMVGVVIAIICNKE
ncbi:MAG: O-antigen ligase family protein [Patescibacteria group bacterium]